MSYVYFRESVSGGWDKEGAVKGRRERVEGRQTLQYSWLALYVSHKLAGDLPLSDSLTEHTLFPARIVSSLHLFSSHSRNAHPQPLPRPPSSPVTHPLRFPKIKVYKLTRTCRWDSSVDTPLSAGTRKAERVGRIADRTTERLVVGSEGTLATRKKKKRWSAGREGGRDNEKSGDHVQK